MTTPGEGEVTSMKVLVFSDTHNSSRRMLEVAMQHRDATACIHLGDGLMDAEVLPTLFSPSEIYKVQGNCDFDSSDLEDRLIPLCGTLLFLTHGHHYGVKYGLDQLWQAASGYGARAALFGHTHTPCFEMRGGLFLFNPGSLTSPRGGTPTYGLIELQRGHDPRFDICHYR